MTTTGIQYEGELAAALDTLGHLRFPSSLIRDFFPVDLTKSYYALRVDQTGFPPADKKDSNILHDQLVVTLAMIQRIGAKGLSNITEVDHLTDAAGYGGALALSGDPQFYNGKSGNFSPTGAIEVVSIGASYERVGRVLEGLFVITLQANHINP